MLFLFKNEARKRQWQVATNRWDLATKKWEPKHHEVLCSKHFEKCFRDCTLLSIQFGLRYMSVGVHRVTDLEKFPVRISKDEAPTPLPVVGPLFPSLSFHHSQALLGVWRFGLFHPLSLSQQARPHHGACLLLGVYFIICKDEKVLFD